MTWLDYSGVIVIALAGSGHCVGMCGGFVLAIGRGAPGPGRLFARHVAYHAGKALTYAFLAVIVAAGFGIAGRSGWFDSAQTALALLAGAIMVAYGIVLACEVRPAAWWRRMIEPLPGCRALGAVAAAPGLLAAFATGWLNGFLPCGLVLAVLFHLASFHSVVGAAAGAVVFGFATMPGLFAFGLAAHSWKPRWRRVLVRVTGGLLVIFGAVTIARAFPEGRAWLHEELVPGFLRTVREWCGVG